MCCQDVVSRHFGISIRILSISFVPCQQLIEGVEEKTIPLSFLFQWRFKKGFSRLSIVNMWCHPCGDFFLGEGYFQAIYIGFGRFVFPVWFGDWEEDFIFNACPTTKWIPVISGKSLALEHLTTLGCLWGATMNQKKQTWIPQCLGFGKK